MWLCDAQYEVSFTEGPGQERRFVELVKEVDVLPARP